MMTVSVSGSCREFSHALSGWRSRLGPLLRLLLRLASDWMDSVSLIDMDDKTFDVCSGFTFHVKYAERSAPVIATFVFQATPFLATVGRLVLKGLFLFCCCVLVLEQGVDGLADSAFAVDYLLFPYFQSSRLSSTPRCPLLENFFPSRHRSRRERLGLRCL